MNKLALTLPGFNSSSGVTITSPEGFNTTAFNSLASVVNGFLNVFFYIAGFLLLIWLVWGIFQYLFAGGKKEALAAAQKRITWAFIGFIIVILAYSITNYVQFHTINLQLIEITNVTGP